MVETLPSYREPNASAGPSAQSIDLQDEYTEVDILRRRMGASVLLIKALGGGWDTSKLPAA